MFLVTGGERSTTTETFDPSVGSWVISGAILPRPLYEARAANINGRLLIFGNDNPKSLSLFQVPTLIYPNTKHIVKSHLYLFYFAGSADDDNDFLTYDDILEYDPEEDIIIPVGHMIQARWNHAVSVVPAEDYLQWCTFL